MKISVIAIFYNSSAYIKKCIQSILDQQDVFIELIAVDDCSTDDTLKLLQEYAIIDDRIKIIKHQKNRGIAAARNSGIKAASGDCFYLIDGDDYLPNNALSSLAKHFSPEVDWIQGGYEIRNEKNLKIADHIYQYGKYTTHQEIENHFFDIELVYTHNKLINCKLKKWSTFSEGIIHEDRFLNIAIYPHLNYIINVPKITYYYIDRPKSFSKNSSFKQPFIDDGLMLLEKMTLLGNKWMTYAQTLAITTILRNIYMGNFTPSYRKEVVKRLYSLQIFPISTQIKNCPHFPRYLYSLIKYPDIIRWYFSRIYLIYVHLFNKPIL